MSKPEERRDRLSALEKALAVLEALAGHPQPVGLPDLAAGLGLPRQTVHRILQQLEANGLALRDPSRERFTVGARCSRLALATLSARNQSAPVRAILADLVDDLNETCNVGVLDGLEFQYLERIECQWSLRVHLTAGSRVPAYCTSGGKVMLAGLDKDLRNALLRVKRLKMHTPNTISRLTLLKAELEAIAKRGYALNDQEYSIGIVGAAVPVKNHAGDVLAALALHGPEQRLSLKRAEKAVPKLETAAQRLAKVWGLSGRRPGRAVSQAAE